MKNKIEVDFQVGEPVIIPNLENAKSIVEQICFGMIGCTYQVSWFSSGERKTAWVHAS